METNESKTKLPKASFGAQKQYYDTYWNHRKDVSLDGKCRGEFIISNIENIKLNFKQSMKIIDLGCGRGWLTDILSNYGDVLGVDLSIDAAEKLYPNLSFKQANIVVDKIDGNYNVVLSSEIIEHLMLEHQKIYIKKAHDLLTYGGYLILTTPNKAIADKLVKESILKKEHLQPIENWLDKKSLSSLIEPYFEIKFIGTTMFFPIFIRKNKMLREAYRFFYYKIGYKIIDKILKSSDRGLYLTIIAQVIK